ncbi:MAG: lipoyl(octanoyl) transferase LipB [Polaromonas sp.]|nr:lipoyl(octanoyl) transferase LipB [Polaromonas sp.]
MNSDNLIDIEQLGLVDYQPTFEAMKAFTAARNTEISRRIGFLPCDYGHDQLWICEHPAVYTQGLAGKPGHILNPGDIPVVQTDRGGQVTFHGPGQVVAYPLMDLRRAGYYVKEYVYRVEEAVIRTLAHFGVTGHRVMGAPGIYVRLGDPFSHARLVQKKSEILEVKGSEPNWGADLVAKQTGSDPHLGSDPMFSGLGKIAALGIKVSRHCTYHGVALNVAMDLEPFSRINPCGYAGLQTTDLSTIGVSASWQDAAEVLGHKLKSYLQP